MSRLTLVTAPTTEPITLAEARRHVLDFNPDTDVDTELSGLITTARQFCETFTHRAFITQTWDLKCEGFPADGYIAVPKAPLVSVTSVTYVDSDGTSQTVSAANYTVVAPSGPECAPGFIVPAYSLYWPVTRSVPNAVTVRFIAGYGAASTVPTGIKQAMKLLIGHWYANREAVNIGNITSELPMAIHALLWPYKSFDGVAA